jgi:hypothetical protein
MEAFSPIAAMDRRWVSRHEATELAKYDILATQEVMVPKGFTISLGGVHVPPLRKWKDFGYEVFRRRQEQTFWPDPKYDADSKYWTTLFRM